jgi:membrane peptidoglycan carboxypeptidase
VRKPADPFQPEPDLLTHRDDDYLMEQEFEAYDDGQDDGLTPDEFKRGKRRKIWRWVRRAVYVFIFLGVTAPIAAFYIIYQNVTVPDPQTVAFGQAQPVTIYYADGSVMTKLTTGARIFVKANAIPINVRHAVEAAEDETFETNNGFDVKAIIRSAYNQVTGGTGGGSTITQEYIKVATGNDQHSITRKINEAAEAYKMTQTYHNKNDILAAYLNIVYFGRGAYGIESAARTYYGVDAAHLTPAQASLLAGMIQAPGRANDSAYEHKRFTYVWGQMVKNHWITQAEYQAGKFPTPLSAEGSTTKLSWDRQLIVNQVEDELSNNGWSEQQLKAQGAQIYTTIMPKAQTDAENAISTTLKPDAKFMNGGGMVINGRPITDNGKPVSAKNPQVKNTETAALVSINPSTGEIIAYYGGNNPKATQLDMASTPHQAGSSFKPYVFTAGLEKMPDKIGINSVYDPSGPQTIQGVTVHNSDGDSCPAPCTVKDAMTNSINTVFYKMGSQVGSPAVRSAAIQAGIKPTQKDSAGRTVPSLEDYNPTTLKGGLIEGGIAIGQYPVSPLDQAQGYSTFANNGMYIQAHFVKKVTDISGQNVLYQFNTPAKPAFSSDQAQSAQIARTVSDSMTDVMKSSDYALANGRPADSKTGTQNYVAADGTNNNWNSNAWTVGFTPQVVTAVWFGHYDRPGPLFGSGNNHGGGHNYSVFGRMEPGQIWKNYMDSYLANQPNTPFPTTPADIPGGWNFITNSSATQAQQPPTNNQPDTQPTFTQPTLPTGPPPFTFPTNPNGGGNGGHHHDPTTTPDTTTCNPVLPNANCQGGIPGQGGAGP